MSWWIEDTLLYMDNLVEFGLGESFGERGGFHFFIFVLLRAKLKAHIFEASATFLFAGTQGLSY
jgi:hypothetical protein